MSSEVTAIQPQQSPLDMLEAVLAAVDSGQADLPYTLRDAVERAVASIKTKSTSEKQTEEIIGDLFRDFDFV